VGPKWRIVSPMNDLRGTISWLLLGLLGVVGAGGAVLGITQAPNNAPLIVCTSPSQPIQKCTGAVPNTLNARNYSEVVTESTGQGTQTDYLTFQSPDTLGGYVVENGSKRTYVYVIGSVEYQSLTVSANASTKHLVFYRQASQGATLIDPVHNYLRYVKSAKLVSSSGGTSTYTLSQDGETGTFVYTVSGQYVSEFNLSVKTASVHLVISQVGTSPPVALPAGAKVVKAPTSGASG
jgi:hypothetical protein